MYLKRVSTVGNSGAQGTLHPNLFMMSSVLAQSEAMSIGAKKIPVECLQVHWRTFVKETPRWA